MGVHSDGKPVCRLSVCTFVVCVCVCVRARVCVYARVYMCVCARARVCVCVSTNVLYHVVEDILKNKGPPVYTEQERYVHWVCVFACMHVSVINLQASCALLKTPCCLLCWHNAGYVTRATLSLLFVFTGFFDSSGIVCIFFFTFCCC